MILITIIAIFLEKTTIMINRVVMRTINDIVINSKTRMILIFIRVKMSSRRAIKTIGSRRRKMHFSITLIKIKRTVRTEEVEVEQIEEEANEVEEKEEKEEKEEVEVKEEVEEVIEDFNVITLEKAITIDQILEEVEAVVTGELVRKNEMKKLSEKPHLKISNSVMKTTNMQIRNPIKKSHTTKTEATTIRKVVVTKRRVMEFLGKE